MGRWHDKELNDLGTEGVRELLQYSDRRVLQSAFKTAHVGSIDIGISGKIFLWRAALDPEAADSAPQGVTGTSSGFYCRLFQALSRCTEGRSSI